MNWRRRLLVAILLCDAVGGRGLAQFEEDGDLIPGLLASYISSESSVDAIEHSLSHNWGTSAPDARVPAGPFSVRWMGQVLLRQQTTYVFHVYVQGEVAVDIDGKRVLSGRRDQPGWISGAPVDLSFGLLDLVVEFHKTQDAAQVHLFWSSVEFPLEPLPPQLLFREEGRPDLQERERGRQSFDAHRCNRCHRRDTDPLSPAAPSLEHVTAGLQPGWLVDKLQSRDAAAPHARMPSFGFSEDEAAAVAAFLVSVTEPVAFAEVPMPPTQEEAPPDGDLLVRSIGCLACHTVNDVGQTGPFSGGDLSAIGEKRSPEWLSQWLLNPQTLNRDQRMPVIKLSDAERGQIARELATWRRAGAVSAKSHDVRTADRESIEHGRRLVEQSRCAACHRIPGIAARLDDVPSLAAGPLHWDRSCLAPAESSQKRPTYNDVDVPAIRSYVESRFGSLSPPTTWTHGRSVLEQRNCLGCHERDLTPGIVPVAGRLERTDARFRGHSQVLIPPSLTAVGDKLHEQALIAAVRGEQKSARLGWLHVRMPRFDHSGEDQAALVSYLVDHDRIPAGAPAGAFGPASIVTPLGGDDAPGQREEILVIGHALTGAGGFNCIACHKLGDYEPRNVALGAKGSDLLMLEDRMRAEYFHRWTREPLRVIPGMEMPNFRKPVPGILRDDVTQQLAAVWQAINDPQFTAPTNPTQVEQLLVVEPEGQPLVVRDVFTVSAANGGGYVARPFAVGFGNGHSLLYDLDRLCVRGWTLGDFARQRTQGKSWYWDLAGLDVARGFDAEPELLLRDRKSGDTLRPITDGGRAGRLIRYTVERTRVVCEQEISFAHGGKSFSTSVRQIVEPFAREGEDGLQRTIRASGVPEEFDLILRIPRVDFNLFGTSVAAAADWWSSPTCDAVSAVGWIVPREGRDGVIRQTFHCSTKRPVTHPPPRPELPLVDGRITTVPGMTGVRLPLPRSMMPTALALTGEGRLVFTSLKGHVYGGEDTDGDGLADKLIELERGLAAPFGVLPFEGGLLVAHKPELLWLQEADGTRPATRREVWADGWGYSDDYHDWTTGPVQDGAGNLYLGIGSNYSQHGRPQETSRWRGTVLRIDRDRCVEPFAQELRYPQGIAFDTQGRLFVSDQQGVANTFNEINHVREGRRYGVKSLYDPEREVPETAASVQVPHPWTRSVNGIFFVPESVAGPLAAFAGHGIGCEYNGKFLIRFSLQEVDGEVQGACYAFSRPTWEVDTETFLGPMCGLATPAGEMYVGSIFDSGWLGGPNTGEIVRLTPDEGGVPNGLRELRATPDGFEIEFLRPVDAAQLQDLSRYSISGYTRDWQGAYATPDSGRYSPQVKSAAASADGQSVRLTLEELREGYVYEVNTAALAADGDKWFPDTGHYTMNRIPAGESHPAE